MRICPFIVIIWSILISCTPPPPIEIEKDESGYFDLVEMRSNGLKSLAYLIDLRINDAGQKFSVITELYCAGDSVGFYGRGYLARGAFKGSILDETVTVYFKQQNEYFRADVAQLNLDADCASPGEVLIYVLSLLSGKASHSPLPNQATISTGEIDYHDGRFYRTVLLKKRVYPRREKLIDPACGDSIVVKYHKLNDEFPYYRVRDLLYYNGQHEFRAKGFVREQKFNIKIPQARFKVVIPADAIRIESF